MSSGLSGLLYSCESFCYRVFNAYPSFFTSEIIFSDFAKSGATSALSISYWDGGFLYVSGHLGEVSIISSADDDNYYSWDTSV